MEHKKRKPKKRLGTGRNDDGSVKYRSSTWNSKYSYKEGDKKDRRNTKEELRKEMNNE